MKNLRARILGIFDVYYSDNTPVKTIVRDLDRNGKFDSKKTIEMLFMLAEEIEEIKASLKTKKK